MNGRRGKRRIVALTMAASLALVPLETGNAHNYNVSSTSTIKFFKRKFHGKVKSSRLQCLKGRKVVVFKNRRQGPDRRIGAGRSIGGGHWKVPKRPVEGKTYYARVKKRRVKRHGHSHRCKAGNSATRTR